MSLVPSFFGTESTQYVSFYCLNNSVKNHSILTVGEVHISGAKVTLKRRHDNICHQKTVNALSHQLHVTAVDGQIHDTTARSACCIRLHSNGGDASGITAIQSMGNKTHYGAGTLHRWAIVVESRTKCSPLCAFKRHVQWENSARMHTHTARGYMDAARGDIIRAAPRRRDLCNTSTTQSDRNPAARDMPGINISQRRRTAAARPVAARLSPQRPPGPGPPRDGIRRDVRSTAGRPLDSRGRRAAVTTTTRRETFDDFDTSWLDLHTVRACEICFLQRR